METVIETKSCKQCGASFEITNKDMEFYNKISPTFAEEKCLIPPPKLCPECRARRRLSFRNERKLYRRTCDLTGKEVISIYSPESPYKICDRHVRRSDQWDAMKYGRAYDFNQSFFQQYSKLYQETPNVALYNVNSVNSEYANHCLGEKNCYMIFGCFEDEDSMYGEGMNRVKSSMDLLRGAALDACYECVDSHNSYKLFRSQKCNTCSESYFLYNCSNCRSCTLCTNMINKSYCIENIQYTKEEYAQKLTELHLDTTTGIRSAKEKMGQLVKNCVHKFADLIQCENVTGDNLEEVKDCQHCFDLKGARDSKYSMHGGYGYNDSYDGYGIGANASLMYETVDTGVDESNVAFTIVVYQSTQAYYSINCHFCHNIFGCIGLRNKEYCILNKQYTKEEYEKIVPQIIRHMEVDGSWGEFFSPAISPFAYNETIANDYFPLSREEALRQGFRRLDRESQINIPENAQKINANDLPESISQVDDSILSKVLICEVTGKPYRIIRQELDFYRKHNIPLPHRHQDERHKERMALRTPRKLRDRTCQKCGISIKTSYAPERKEVIYCEQCYNKELYG